MEKYLIIILKSSNNFFFCSIIALEILFLELTHLTITLAFLVLRSTQLVYDFNDTNNVRAQNFLQI